MKLLGRACLARGVVWSCTFLALWAPQARSGEAETGPWQVELSAGVRALSLPTFDAPVGDATVVGYPGLISEDFNMIMRGGSGRVTYTSRGGWLLELGGGYWSGGDRVSAQPGLNQLNDYSLAATGLDGVSGILSGGDELEGGSVYASVDASLLAAGARLARTFEKDRLLLRPFVGLLYERSVQDYSASFRLMNPVINNFELPYRLSQEVDSRRLGGEVGLQATVKLGENWRLDAGVGYALYRQRTSMTASDCAASATASPGFECEDTTAFNYVRLHESSASDEADRVGSRIKLEAGLSHLFSFGVLGVRGFAQYDTDVAGVKNPLLTQDQFLNADPTRPPPAHLVFDGAWSYGATVSLSIPLP